MNEKYLAFRLFHLMSPCLHVHISRSMSPCFISPCFHVSMSMSSCFHVSITMSPFLLVHVSHVLGIPQTENETNGKWHLPFVCCKRKTKTLTSVCLLQTETVNGRLFSLVSKRYMVIDDCLFQQTCQSMPKSLSVRQGSLPVGPGRYSSLRGRLGRQEIKAAHRMIHRKTIILLPACEVPRGRPQPSC